jgi:HNH endonuclease
VKLSELQSRILALLEAHKEGISITQLRLELGLKSEQQQHLDRRVRTLDEHFVIQRQRHGRDLLYVFSGKRKVPRSRGAIPNPLRARVLMEANNRCAMCGRSSREEGIVLQVDHIIPVEWGGTSNHGNLQALCRDCNQGKKNFFASFDKKLMTRVMSHSKIHHRLAEILLACAPHPVESYLLAAIGGQDDWKKRLRELRTLGWKIRALKKKTIHGVKSSYVLIEKGEELGADPAKEIRRREKANKQT